MDGCTTAASVVVVLRAVSGSRRGRIAGAATCAAGSRRAAELQAQLERLQCVALHINHGHLDPALVKAVHNSGHGILAYTVNDSQTAIDLLEWGVDALVTDQLDAITPAFA